MSPKSAKHIVQCEVMLLLTAMKRRVKNHDDKSEPHFTNLLNLKNKLGYIADLSDIRPLEYLGPFLDVISSGEMIGLITGLALTAVEKFLSFRYLDFEYIKDMQTLQETMEKIANTVTNTKFVGTDHSSDEVILMKILKTLDTLMHVPAGVLISDSAVCKIISSCFRICFEMQLSELLRHTAECTFTRIIHLLFKRLPELKDDLKHRKKNLTINFDFSSNSNTKSRIRRKKQASVELLSDQTDPSSEDCDENSKDEGLQQIETSDESVLIKKQTETINTDDEITESEPIDDVKPKSPNHITILLEEDEKEDTIKVKDSEIVFELSRNESNTNMSTITNNSVSDTDNSQYKTSKGIVFKSEISTDTELPTHKITSNKKSRQASKQNSAPIDTSYGLACIQKLLSNLTMMLAPENTMHINHVRTGLTLVTAALEVGSAFIAQQSNSHILVNMIQNDLSKHLILLLNSDRLSFFAASTRACFLLFESMRHHLKYQLEMYLCRLTSIITSDNESIPLDYREVALESIVQLWMIPGFITELYINYDCQLYSRDLLQQLSELFYRTTMPSSAALSSTILDPNVGSGNVTMGSSNSNGSGGINTSLQSGSQMMGPIKQNGPLYYSAHMQMVALESLLFLIHSINKDKDIQSADQQTSMNSILLKKRALRIGTEKFNEDPKSGLKYLKNEGFCQNDKEIAEFLHINFDLDKKMIGELIGKRNCTEILNEYLRMFDCRDARIDQAVRSYLEEFRLPGDSANIEIIFDTMSKIYCELNPHLIENPNSSYLVIYLIIMLNVSHHNVNAKKQQAPMDFQHFRKMLQDKDSYYLDEETMVQIFDSVKNNEIVMPIEQKGLLKENYLWKRLIRRSNSTTTPYQQSGLGNRSFELFNLIWKSCINAFVYVFEVSSMLVDDSGLYRERIIQGLYQCATISAFYNLCEIMDKIIILVSKYTNFASPQETVEMFGKNEKTQIAALTMFQMAQKHADIIRDGWKNLLDCMIALFKAKLLPRSLIEVEDLITKDKILLPNEEEKLLTRQETSSVVNWFFSGLSLTSSQDYGSGQRNQAEEVMRNEAMEVVERCGIPQLIEDTRFIKGASLNELINALIHGTRSGEDAFIKSYQMYHRSNNIHNSASTGTMLDTAQCPTTTEGDVVVSMSTDDQAHHHHGHGITGSSRDEQSRVFCLELLVRVLLHNSDRIAAFRPIVYDHFYTLLIGAVRSDLLLERAVVAALRLTIQLLRKEQDLDQVFTYLEILALTKMNVLSKVNLHIVCGLRDIIHSYASNIPLKKDWKLLLTLLEICGAGTKLDPIDKAEFVSRLKLKDISSLKKIQAVQAATQLERYQEMCTSVENIPCKFSANSQNISGSREQLQQVSISSNEQRGYTSDSELYKASSTSSLDNTGLGSGNKWVLLPPENNNKKEDSNSDTNVTLYSEYMPQVNQYNIVLNNVEFAFKDVLAIEKSCELLSYLINDPAHITPTNFEACVHTLRIFAEACVRCPATLHHIDQFDKDEFQSHSNRKSHSHTRHNKSKSHYQHIHSNNTSNQKNKSDYRNTGLLGSVEYNTEENEQMAYKFSAQLGMLMNTLHCRAKKIYLEWNNSNNQEKESTTNTVESNALYERLWKNCWCPLLQGMARLCSDVRPSISAHAINVLHNSLSITDMSFLSGVHWEDCFTKVLFPLSTCFLETMKLQNEAANVASSNPQSGQTSNTNHAQLSSANSQNQSVGRYVIETSDPRIRAIQILTKVFLQHLGKLAELSTFTALWLTFLEYMDSYMKSNSQSDSLQDAVRETLKNVLLVMYTGMQDGTISMKPEVSAQLLKLTCDRLLTFLPDLVTEVFGSADFQNKANKPSEDNNNIPSAQVDNATETITANSDEQEQEQEQLLSEDHSTSHMSTASPEEIKAENS